MVKTYHQQKENGIYAVDKEHKNKESKEIQQKKGSEARLNRTAMIQYFRGNFIKK